MSFPRLAALVALALLALSSPAAAATLQGAVSADPTEDAPVGIDISGTGDSPALRLFVSVGTGGNACGAKATDQEAVAGNVRLTPTGGLSTTGSTVTTSLTFVPVDDGTFRLCAYLAEGAETQPTARVDQAFVVRQPSALVTTTVTPNEFEPGQRLEGRVSAQSAGPNRELRFAWQSGAAGCASWSWQTATGVGLTPNVPFSTDTAVPSAAAERYHLCALVVERGAGGFDAAAEAFATPLTGERLIDRWRPVLLTDERDQYDRLRLRWRSRSEYDEGDILRIWDVNPASGGRSVVSEPADSDRFEFMDGPVGVSDVRVRNFLGFRQFWWTVGSEMPDGTRAWSQPRTVRVIPTPMKKSRVRVSPKLTLRRSSKRPGMVRLRVTSSPRARVRLTIKYRGRTYAKRNYTEGVGGLRGFDFKLSCNKTGRFSYTAKFRDPYGARVTRRGHWTSSASRCASLKAEERRKAAAEERKRRAAQQPSSDGGAGGGGGGGGCHPSYSPQCLKVGIGDYDCPGGTGNGPNYVPGGPVYVNGDDPFDLDRDGNGVGCQS